MGGLALLGLGAALWLHGRNRGHQATIATLTKLAGPMIVCLMLNGCADVIFTASGALAPKVVTIVAVAGAAGTVAKSAVDGVSAIEELKAISKGKNPQKPVSASEPGALVTPNPASAKIEGGTNYRER